MVIVREYRVRRRIVNWLEVNCTTFMWLHGSYVFQPWHVAVFLVLRFAKKKKISVAIRLELLASGQLQFLCHNIQGLFISLLVGEYELAAVSN